MSAKPNMSVILAAFDVGLERQKIQEEIRELVHDVEGFGDEPYSNSSVGRKKGRLLDIMGALSAETDWRPDVTIAEDYYA